MLEDVPATAANAIAKPLNLPRGIGGYQVTYPGSDAFDYESIISEGLALIPQSAISAVEQWRTFYPTTTAPRSLRLVFGSGSPNTEQTKRRIGAICGDDGQFEVSWGGISLTEFRIFQMSQKSSTTVHEYGHYIDRTWLMIADDFQYERWLTDRADFMTCFDNSIPPALPETGMYGRTNRKEWFAELFAMQLMPSYLGSGFWTNTRAFYALCNYDPAIAGYVRAMFLELMPDLPPKAWANPESSTVIPTITGRPLGDVNGNLIAGQQIIARTYIEESGKTPTWTVSSGSIPAGLVRNGATISGTPTALGAYDFTLTVQTSSGTLSRRFRGFVFDPTVPAPTITTSFLPNGYLREAYPPFQVAFTNANQFSLISTDSRFWDGLTISSLGVISGMPTNNQGYDTGGTLMIRAMGPGGVTDKSVYLTLGVRVTFMESALPTLRVGQSANIPVNVNYTKSLVLPQSRTLISGSIPPGLTLSLVNDNPNSARPTPLWVITGTPLTPGPYSFTLRVQANNEVGTQTFSGEVLPVL